MQRLLPFLQAALAGSGVHQPLGQTVGYRIVELSDGGSLIELPTDERHGNSMGYTHGGAICAIADTALGMAHATTLYEGETSTMVEIKVNFLRPVFQTVLQARGEVVKRGRTLSLVECSITDAEGKLVARAYGTLMTLRGEQAEGRTHVHPER